MISKDQVTQAILGFVVGDALGVPVEFVPRKVLQEFPVEDFVGGGKHNVPTGFWSDDSSTMLCLIETFNEAGLDFELYCKKLLDWLYNGYMTPNGKPFGLGRTTIFGLNKVKKGVSFLHSGETSEQSNGNGSLMRILPLVFILQDDEYKFKIVEICSGITHAHQISKIACAIYVEYFQQLIKTNHKIIAYENMQKIITDYYKDNQFISAFDDILKGKIYEKPVDELSGLGYVVSTLETVLHCFINGKSYRDCVLKAINIGNDTDTNAAITGALAGYYYQNIPEIWIKKLIKLNEIQQLIDFFVSQLDSDSLN